MPSLTNNKEVFNSVADPSVVSPNIPGGDVGVSKTTGEEGFFIKSETSFSLWFKDGSGVWNLSNDSATTGTYQWDANQSFYIQSDSATRFFVFKRNEAPAAQTVVQRGDQTNRPRAFDPPTAHSNLGSTWTASGHTGEPYSIGLFGISGAGGFLSAPPSGQREVNILGWDANGDIGWIAAPAASGATVLSPDLYFDGSSTSSQIGTNTVSNATISTDDGKYETGFFDFGATGNLAPVRIGDDIDLSTGIYTFSLWFYNKRAGTDWGGVLRQTSGTSPGTTANYPIITRNSDNRLGLYKSAFYDTGYDMTSLEGNLGWTHLTVVADGTTSTFYVDGVQAGNPINTVITTSVGELGAYDGIDTQVFAEGIGEFAYWSSELSAAEILAINDSAEKLSSIINNGIASPPTITLLGDSPMIVTTLPVTDPGATAEDVQDGSLTAQITSDWDAVVGANPADGSYLVTYSVTDTDGNATTATRNVYNEDAPAATVSNAQSNGTPEQGATIVNGMYIDMDVRGSGRLLGIYTDDMRPDDSADSFSFSAFWRLTTANDNDAFWLFGGRGNMNDSGWGIRMYKRSETQIEYQMFKQNSNGWNITDLVTTTVFDEFHHVAFTYTNETFVFYHDGIAIQTFTGQAFAPGNPGSGTYLLGNGWAIGAIDEVSLFKNTFLTDGEIFTLASERSQKDTDYTNNT